MSTEPRSRDEWLVEVKRRGERIRRRRMARALLGVLALFLPATALAGFLTAGPDPGQELSVAGPAPAPAAAAAVGDSGPAGDGPSAPGTAFASQPASPDGPAPPAGDSAPAVDIPNRLAEEPALPASGSVTLAPPGSVAVADDPVVRATTTVTAPRATGAPLLLPNQSTASATSAGPAAAQQASCPAEALQIDVVPSKATFAVGQAVSGTFFLQTRQARDCAISLPSSFRIEEVATGKVLGTVAAVTDLTSPLRAEPGKMLTSTFSWDQSDCSGGSCDQASPGLYQAVAVWSDGAPYRGWGEFRIAS